jgi:DNA polymerase III subunit delta'
LKKLYQKNWNFLLNAHKKGKLAHALFFCGAEGTGKFEFSIQLAKEIGGYDQEISQLMAGQHPDLFIVEPQLEEKKNKTREKEISIGQVRESLEKAKFFPYQASCKFLIVKKAEKMTAGAANSILKITEEPASDLKIILTAENEDAVLPTIKSRCQVVRFGLLEIKKVADYLENDFQTANQTKFSPKSVAQAVELSRGRVKLAEKMVLNKDFLLEVQEVIDNFRSALRSGVHAGLKLSERLATDKKKLLETIDQWLWYLEGFMKKLVEGGSDSRILSKVLGMIKDLAQIKVALNHLNVSERLLLENFFVKINW